MYVSGVYVTFLYMLEKMLLLSLHLNLLQLPKLKVDERISYTFKEVIVLFI